MDDTGLGRVVAAIVPDNQVRLRESARICLPETSASDRNQVLMVDMRFFPKPRSSAVLGPTIASLLTVMLITPSAPAAADDPQASSSTKSEAKSAPPSRTKTETKRYTLPELMQLAYKRYPGLQAARHEKRAMEYQLYQARWAWVPRGKVEGLFAPTPEINCVRRPREGDSREGRVLIDGEEWVKDEKECVRTDTEELSLTFNGVYGRIKLDLAMPLYTFGKIGAAKRAARAGVRLTEAKLAAARQDLDLKVVQAYWGLRAARDGMHTIREGRKHLDKALARIEEELDSGEGESTVSDLLRLKTKSAEVDTLTIETRKLARLALASIALLTGLDDKSLQIDADFIEPVQGELRPAKDYVEIARHGRPEVRMLEAGVRASQAKVALEKAAFFPNFLLVGTVGIGRATNIDNPKNTFFDDPNFTSSGIALAMSWDFNMVEQYGKYRSAKSTAAYADAKRREAVIGIEAEIREAHESLNAAIESMQVARRGQKTARSWLVATSQNLAAGLAEPKELSDALVEFFKLRLQYVKSIFDVNVGWAKLARKVGLAMAKLAGSR